MIKRIAMFILLISLVGCATGDLSDVEPIVPINPAVPYPSYITKEKNCNE